MKRMPALAALTLIFALLACAEGAQPDTATMAERDGTARGSMQSAFDLGKTTFGFFPSPPEASAQAVLKHFSALGKQADFILIQPNVPWADFAEGVQGESKSRSDLMNQRTLAQVNGMGWILVVDPLNGLDRSEFFGLPEGWEPSFGDPQVRAAYTNFTLWSLDEFQPRSLGLASEINTYMDAHPEETQNFLSLYRETYDLVKERAPDTQVFVTFQWDDLNNMFPTAAEGRAAYQTNWHQVEAFEPRLDVWAISSYPYFVFPSGEAIPADYFRPLLGRTDKPVAVAEGGFSSRPVGPAPGSREGQVAYLQALDDQLGERLAFWVYLVLDDLNMESIGSAMAGRPSSDLETLRLFSAVGLRRTDGTPKPALDTWERLRRGE
jgi:hypothetical protein